MEYFNIIENKLREKVASDVEITEASTLIDLGIDSFDLVELITTIEDELNIVFEDEELYDLKSIKDVLSLIKQKVK